MTEVDLSQLFARQPQLTREQERAIEALHDRQHAEEMLAFARVQFFAPVLCACDRRYDWAEPSPPQLGCVIHGHMQTDHDGRVLMFARPREPHRERGCGPHCDRSIPYHCPHACCHGAGK